MEKSSNSDMVRFIKKHIDLILSALVLVVLIIIFATTGRAQEIGYLTGFTKQGINPANAQPIYGITLQKQFSKYAALESNVFYSQRMKEKKIQSDYLSFMFVGKFGYFSSKVGAYGLYGFSLNPSLTHANNENHTYGSLNIGAGGQLKLFNKTWAELKGYYDCGLSGAYYKEGSWSDYRGLFIMSTLKFKI